MGKVVVYAPGKREDTLLLFLLYPFVLCGSFVGFNSTLPSLHLEKASIKE
jgi:hypothetical protein